MRYLQLLCAYVLFSPVSLADANATLLESLTERNQDFQEALERTIPLRPYEVHRAKEAQEAFERAMAPRPAKMRTDIRTITLPPSGPPHILHVSPGYSSTVMFQDRTGAPWPITHTVIGNPKAYSLLHLDKENNGHMLNIVPLTDRDNSNIVVGLVRCPYPIIVHCMTTSSLAESRSTDALLVFRINQDGPNAKKPNGTLQEENVATEVISLLHGIPDPNANPIRFTTHLQDTQAWEKDTTVYLRTPYALLWPAWRQHIKGEGVNLYVLPKTNSLVLSVNGTQTTLARRTKENP